MITIHDINIFILSHNREQYILETLTSLRQQNIGNFEIKILDNGSTDNTQKSVAMRHDENIIFLGSETDNGALWNYQRAQDLASRKYCILFHDDDLIHPKYLEYVLQVLNEQKDLSIICSGMQTTLNPSNNGWKDYRYNPIIFDKLSQFASLAYFGFPFNFGSVVYKTENFKKTKIDPEQYGKIGDRPFVFDCVQNGKIALFPGQYIQYRIHENQDSKDSKSGPFYNETLALHKKYKNIFYENNRILLKLVFLINFYGYAREEYNSFYNIKHSKEEYINLIASEIKITSIDLFLSKSFYFTKIKYIYKLYRFIKRTFHEYS